MTESDIQHGALHDDGLGACRGIMCALLLSAGAGLTVLSLLLAYLARS